MIVLDSSALLALLKNEPGAEAVADHLDGALMSTLNVAEVLSKIEEWGGDSSEVLKEIALLPINLIPLSLATATGAARFRPHTKSAGLSLGDRICLALAQERGCEAWTADKRWASVKLGVTVHLIR